MGPTTVLIIDDLAPLLKSVERMFHWHFPKVTVTGLTSAKEALGRIQSGERWDAIICDLSMPEMDGVTFYEELEKVDPALASRTIILTGGATNPRDQAFCATHPTLEKPFKPDDLRSALGLD